MATNRSRISVTVIAVGYSCGSVRKSSVIIGTSPSLGICKQEQYRSTLSKLRNMRRECSEDKSMKSAFAEPLLRTLCLRGISSPKRCVLMSDRDATKERGFPNRHHERHEGAGQRRHQPFGIG